MKREVFVVENGCIVQDNTPIFKDLSIQLFAGEIAGLAFDNLMEQRFFLELLQGERVLSSGQISLEEQKESFAAASVKLAKWTAVIGRKSSLIPSVSIEDNIFMFSDKSYFISQKKYKQQLSKLKQEFGILAGIPDRMQNLTIKERVMIELLKAYVGQKKIVILEDVVGALTKSETEELFAFMDQTKEEMTFLVIAGFEDIDISHLDRMVLIQNGRSIAMSQLMIQKRGLNQILQVLINESGKPDKLMTHLSKTAPKECESILRAENVSTDYLENFNLNLKTGEIQKIYYSDEQTKEHIWGLFSGEVRLAGGTIYLGNKAFRVKDMSEAIKQGIGFILEKPYHNELMDNISVIENMSMPLQEKVHGYWMFKKYTQSVGEYIKEMHLDLKRVRDMSSLEKQKMVYEKWLLYMPKVLICQNPFADIDINMQNLTMKMIHVLQKRGISILILTSNLYTMGRIPGKSQYYYRGKYMDENKIWEIITRGR